MTGLNLLVLLMGAISTTLIIVLSVIALWGKISEALKGLMVDVLVNAGLIKHVHPGETLQDVWPNGSSNLPDFLYHLWQVQVELYDDMKIVKGERADRNALLRGRTRNA